MEFCFLTGGLLLGLLSAGRPASCSVFLSAASLLAKNGDIEYARLPAYKGRGI